MTQHTSPRALGEQVDYRGSLTEHHGRYSVVAFNHYSGRYTLKGCDRFTVGSMLHDVSPRSIHTPATTR